MHGLSIHAIYKSFGEKQALRGVSLEAPQGQILALLGPSGCGKSTLLYTIAGLERPDQGEVRWDGAPLTHTPPHRRGFGLMFQDFALFPHKDVYQNVAFGLRMAGAAPDEIRNRVEQALALVGLPGFAARDVNTLSGGEAQRIALARALAPRPRLLMFDEPLGSLDRGLRERLAADLAAILRQSRQTAIYVTHDQEEAFMIADRVAVMNAGQVEQVGEPREIFRQPQTVFVARFLGLNNLLPGQVEAGPGGLWVVSALGRLPIPAGGPAAEAASSQVTLLVRPDEARLVEEEAAHAGPGVDGGGSAQKPAQPAAGEFLIHGRLAAASFRGSLMKATLVLDGAQLEFDLPSNSRLPAPGERITLRLPLTALQLFPS
ncbi:MAG: ABC transporter ATP-binding protein [Chloroflexota bacterium]